MEAYAESDILSVERTGDGLIVLFQDRISAFYPASLLRRAVGSESAPPLEGPLTIVSIDRTQDGSLMVEFSDGTVAFFDADELAELRPDRVRPINDQLL